MQSKEISQRGYYAIIFIFAVTQFQVNSACDLHGFSPQSADENLGRSRRDGETFRSFFAKTRFHENIDRLTESGDILTREIRIKQGKLKGLVRELKNKKLKNVETFLGIPYAAPPIKTLRFMPPGSPPTWTDLKIFDSFGPVCPQIPPDLSHEPLKNINAGLFYRLKGLLPFLANQSEDCLYLNIYAPLQDMKPTKKFPVIVYIHGESFDWNSGNPYDGSVLASYGNVVVVTINFRLGILGFLKPGLSEHTVSNFGLLDQIAALQWIKDNIEEFGGDPSSVTLMGQGTGLFHKAILMSGTALSDWAITNNPLQFTIQVAEALNCPLIEKNDELSNCLRRKRLSEIMSVKVTRAEFQTPFGPVVDGSVIPNTPKQVMGVYQNLFTRYDLLYGLAEWEIYHTLDPVTLTYGMLETERNELLRKYMYSRYEALPYFALATTLSEYLDWRKPLPSVKSAAEEHRDLVLDLLSDARFAAPIVQMALYHSKINPKSYLYVFRHKSKFGEFAGSERSVSGEEIAYAFGSPLLNEESSLSHHKFTLSEQLLSESILTYFTNFAKTGNPNAPRRLEYLTLGPKEWQNYDLNWPEYDAKNQSYLAFGIPSRVDHHYRAQMTNFWNKILPDLLSNPSKVKQQPTEKAVERADVVPPRKPTWNSSVPSFYKKLTKDKTSWTYGTVRLSPDEYQKEVTPFRYDERTSNPSSKQMDYPLEDVGTNIESAESPSSWLTYLVMACVCLLIINVVAVAYYYFRKKNFKVKDMWKKTRERSVSDGGFEERLAGKSNCAGNVYTVSECSGSTRTKAEALEHSTKSLRLKKVFANTAEGPAKVKRWIQSEILSKHQSKRKRTERGLNPEEINLPAKKSSTAPPESSPTEPSHDVKSILKNCQKARETENDSRTRSKRTVEKVSIGVDATPSSRGASVLKQIPIEITKSLDGGLLHVKGHPSVTSRGEGVRRSRTSISLQLLPTDDTVQFLPSTEPEVIKLEPKSDDTKNSLRTFLPKHSEDINVTSRDSKIVPVSSIHVDPLENIQKRNFPKVLPDFPNFKAVNRLSFPQSTILNIGESNRNKLYPPPPPPPRVSTLQRKAKQNFRDQPNELSTSDTDKKAPNAEQPKARDTHKTNSSVGANDPPTEGKKGEESAPPPPQRNDNGPARKREKPVIVIHPKIGPKKSIPKKAHINLQAKESTGNTAKIPPVPYVLDSKGPSDKAQPKKEEINMK